MNQPDFLVIGAQKGGTTWLDRMLKSHPGIWTPPVKELQFFNELYMPEYFKWTKSHRDSHAKKFLIWICKNEKFSWSDVQLANLIATGTIDNAWYESIFRYAPADSVKGEMTPEYSLLPDKVVQDISINYAKTKIIFVMREPLSRTISHLKMRLLQEGYSNHSSEDIENFCLNELDYWDIIERSNYGSIIERWKKHFGTERCLFLLSDDLLDNGDLALNTIAKYLEISPSMFEAESNSRIHESQSFPISENVIMKAKEKLAENIDWYNSECENFKIK